ncbi:putative 54S ribosomal protein L22, mitochondrial [Xylona heveae TC161]|uniref:Putative 54S ribosomal protein L22, mitochondrial n=1 Tax=Xylona heveae (strain CBS 132557 / TC161) TaxID=1328760 RepID=A0A164ZDY1_XYLHT|nr:putative 54S ribosomal protein L22, mitochondrial [Xylona heveae TC161]KZF18981.1 putative 54S ribosomal protein L22, mitochondrial [Xylona heveae TC161]
MSLRIPTRRLAQPAVALSSSPSLLTPFTPFLQRRTIFGLFKREKTPNAVPENPITAEFLKRKPREAPAIIRGDLSSSSIFETDEAGPKPSAEDVAAISGPRMIRDPSIMAAALDPDPKNRQRWERKMVIRDVQKRGRLTRTLQIKRTERESASKSHFIKTSIKKLGPLARQITGKSIEDAIVQMRYSKKKAAKSVLAHLEHARNEAVVRRGMGLGELNGTKGAKTEIELKDGKRKLVTDRSGIYIDQAWVGRGPYGKDYDFRARGQVNLLRLPYTSISVILKEEATRIREHEERQQKRARRKLWTPLPNRPITAQRQYYSW